MTQQEDMINTVIESYKNELAQANNDKIIIFAQLEGLKKELVALKEENDKLKLEKTELKDKLAKTLEGAEVKVKPIK